jgi:hypothetical protein
VTTFNDTILVTGGYAGGTNYLNSVELLSASLDRWTTLPPMSVARSGMAAVLGPDGAVYVAGGSPDGTIGHKGLERYDLREGKWTPLREMQCGRGYTAGCVGACDQFYVSGGLHNHKFQSGIEAYDFRTGLWTTQEVAPTAGLSDLIIQVKELTDRRDQLLDYIHALTPQSPGVGEGDLRSVFTQAAQDLSELNERLAESARTLSWGRQAAQRQLSVDHFKRACHVLVGII